MLHKIFLNVYYIMLASAMSPGSSNPIKGMEREPSSDWVLVRLALIIQFLIRTLKPGVLHSGRLKLLSNFKKGLVILNSEAEHYCLNETALHFIECNDKQFLCEFMKTTFVTRSQKCCRFMLRTFSSLIEVKNKKFNVRQL